MKGQFKSIYAETGKSFPHFWRQVLLILYLVIYACKSLLRTEACERGATMCVLSFVCIERESTHPGGGSDLAGNLPCAFFFSPCLVLLLDRQRTSYLSSRICLLLLFFSHCLKLILLFPMELSFLCCCPFWAFFTSGDFGLVAFLVQILSTCKLPCTVLWFLGHFKP